MMDQCIPLVIFAGFHQDELGVLYSCLEIDLEIWCQLNDA